MHGRAVRIFLPEQKSLHTLQYKKESRSDVVVEASLSLHHMEASLHSSFSNHSDWFDTFYELIGGGLHASTNIKYMSKARLF